MMMMMMMSFALLFFIKRIKGQLFSSHLYYLLSSFFFYHPTLFFVREENPFRFLPKIEVFVTEVEDNGVSYQNIVIRSVNYVSSAPFENVFYLSNMCFQTVEPSLITLFKRINIHL